MATQKDIALSLGISQPTVGSVLGNHSKRSTIQVTPELRERILQRAREMNYRPNLYAQRMRGLPSRIIGIAQVTSLLQSIIQRQVFAAREITKRGYQTVTADAVADGELSAARQSTRLVIDQMIDLKVDGVILMVPGLIQPEDVQRLHAAKIPTVSVSGGIYPGTPFVGVDVEQGFRILTRHVIQQGYRRLILITQEHSRDPLLPTHFSIQPRVNGFTSEIKQQGGELIIVDELDHARRLLPKRSGKETLQGCVLSTVANQTFEDTYEVGYRAMNKILDFDLEADLIMMPNDNWLQGALLAASQRCIRIPEQLGLTGFDASPFGQYGYLPFTTVAQPTEAIMTTATEILFSMIENQRWDGPMETRLPCHLIPGNTTRLHPLPSPDAQQVS